MNFKKSLKQEIPEKNPTMFCLLYYKMNNQYFKAWEISTDNPKSL